MQNAKGYQGGTSSVTAGSGPGGTVYTGTGGGGAGYGGNGGYGHTGVGASSYGSLTAPTDAGSGGSYGGSGAANGGAGGGYIKITATDLTLTGTIAANGGAGTAVSSFYTGSGGSGGGIYLSVSGTFNGSGGTITATGGAGTILGGVGSGGGGGGRVAIVGYTTYTAPTTFTAYAGAAGGGASATGGAGSLFVKSNSNNGTAAYNNNGSTYATLSVLSNTEIDELIVRNGAGISIPAGVSVTTTQSNFSNLTAVSANIYLAGTFNPQNASFTIPSSTNVLFAATGRLQTVTNLTMDSTSSTLTRGATLSVTDLTVGAGGTLALASYTTSTSALSLTNLTVNGTLTTSANTTTLAHIVNVSATTVTVGAAGSIQVNAKGYQGGTSTITSGSGPGGAVYSGSGSGGAAYGGSGGYGATGAGASSVGSLTAPADAGAGGAYGGSAVAVGGAGGGFIKITTTNLALAGTIAANGGAGVTAATFYTGSGGAGGGIYLDVSGTFNGSSGAITATGGAGTTLGGYSSGGGGGGRVAIVGYTSYTAPTTFTAYGGARGGGGAANGGAGSLFVKSNSNNGTATYNNNGSTDTTLSVLSNTEIDEIVLSNGAALSIPAGVSVTTTQSNFSNLTAVSANIRLAGTFNPQNTSFTFSSSTAVWFAATAQLNGVTNLTINSVSSTIVSGLTHSLSALTIGSGATFTMDSYTTGTSPLTVATITIDGTVTHTTNTTAQTHIVNLSATNFTVNSGGSINVNSKGYRGGQTGSTTGLGPGGATYTATGGSGAAHGGAGGNGNGSTGSIVTYGSAIAPDMIGSGGSYGGSGAANGGAGGGVIQVTAVTATIAGTISANGQIGTAAATYYAGGGGSGGSVYLNVSGSYDGTGGTVTANGGAGIIANVYGSGGGGGGRIAIGTLEGAITNIGTVTVTGGVKGIAAAQDGSVGTKANRPDSYFTLSPSYTNLTLPATITGTSTYQFNEVSAVAVTIQRAGDSLYWTGTIWDTPVAWLAASGTSTWSYALSGVSLTDLETYTVRSRATDSLSVAEATYPSSSFSYTASSAPDAPSDVALSAVATSTLAISWTDNSSGLSQETNFIVYQSADDSTYTSLATLAADVTTAELTGLTPNTFYYFKVTASNTDNGSNTSTAVSTTTHANLPASFTISTTTSETMTLTWSANGNASGSVYEVLNQTTSTWLVATTTETSYVVTGLTANTAYTFGVRTIQVNSSPTSYSSEATASTSTLPYAPTAPSSLVLSQVATTTASLAWTDNSSTANQESSVIVYQSTDGSSYAVYNTYAADTVSAELTGLSPNQLYYFKVTAQNVSGIATSTDASTSTLANPPTSLVVGTVTTSTVPLSWSANSNVNTTVYEILNQTTSTWSVATTTATAYTVRNLDGNTTYSFGVRAIQAGSSPTSYSSEASVSTTTVSNIPAVPTALTLTDITTSTATLTWTDNASGGTQESSVYVLRSTDNSSYSVISTLAADTVTTGITGLTPNQTYYFKVSASNVSGSGLSDAVSSSTLLMIPTSLSSGVATTSTIPLTWSANGNAVGTVYEVLNQTTSTWSVATTTATSYTVQGLIYDTPYTFGLRAVQNGSSPISYSEEITYSTTTYLEVPTAPTSLVLTNVATSTATLSWTDTASGSTGETSMLVSRSTDDISYSVVATLAADVVTTNLTGLTPNTTYYFKVSAANRSGGATSTAVTTSTIVMTPTSFTANAVTTSTVPLTWSANGNAAGTVYEVLNQTTSTWSVATTTATSYTVRSLESQTSYTFAVLAWQTQSSPTSYSAEQILTTSTQLNLPSTPTSLAVSAVASSTLTLTWTDNASGGDQEDSMIVSRSTDGVTYSVISTLAADTVSTDLTGLTPNVLYYFTVSAFNVTGSATSSAISTSTKVVAPTSFTAGVITTSTVPLTWSANGNGAGTVYEILNQTTSTWSVATTTDTAYTVRSLESNTAYTFDVRAWQTDSDPTSYSSSASYSTTTALDTPSAPTGVTVSNLASSTLTLTWTDNSSAGTQESNVIVSRSIDDVSYSVIATLAADVITTGVTGLTPNQLYYFKVSAANSTGSGTSTAVSTSTLVMTPTSFGASGSVTTSTIPLSWSANGNVSGTVYEILNQTTSTWSVATTTATTYTVSDLVYDTTYTFAIRALQASSSPTSYSSEATYTTTTALDVPIAPSAVTFSLVTTSTATLAWTDNSSGGAQETSVLIARSTDDVTYTTVASLAADTITTDLTGLTPNTTYYFKVGATSPSGSATSSAASTSTLVMVPVSFGASGVVTASTVPLTWSANGNPSGTVYEILNETTSTWSVATTTATTYSVEGLQPLTAYTFGVRALQTNSTPTSYSETVSYTTTTLLGAPIAPTGLVFSNVTTSTASLAWTDNASGGTQEDSVIVSRSTDGTTYSNILTLAADTVSVNLTSLTANTLYYFKVTVVNASGAATSSAVSTTTQALLVTITPPTSVTANATGDSVLLAWSNPVDPDFGSITIRRSASAYPSSISSDQAVASGLTGTSYTDSSLSDGTYYYSLFALDLLGNPSIAATSSVLVATVAPSISAVTSTATASTATITWTTDNAASSKVVYGPDTSYVSTTVESDTVSRVTSHSVILSSLLSCSSYHFQVVSRDAAGNAATSSDELLTTGGCSGDAAVLTKTDTTIPTSTGGTLTLGSGDFTVSLIIPLAYATSNANFQIKQLEKSPVLNFIGTPDEYSSVEGDHIFDLRAVTPAQQLLTTFVEPIQIIMHYEEGDMTGLDEEAARIYRYDDGAWHALSNCAVNTTLRTVSCETSNFSIFGLFGVPAVATPTAQPSRGGGGAIALQPAIFVQPLNKASSLSFSINEGTSVTADRTLRLSLNADPRTARGYAVSIDPAFPKASLLPYTSNPTFTLPAVFGSYTVYLRYYSITGDPSPIISKTIGYYAAVPSVPMSVEPLPIAANIKPILFTRTLKLRDTGQDVKRLQQFLNTHGCVIAKNGAGSKGKETTLYGAATQKAVKACQEKYAKDLLTPAKLKKGTGVFGELARAWANTLLNKGM